MLFPFVEYWWFYLGFTGLVLSILALDLGVFHKNAHIVSLKEASIWTLLWIGLAGLFNIGFYYYLLNKFGDPALAKQYSLEFLTGFVVEKSLAVDNIFIFAVIFSYFAVPQIYQHRILFFGIIGALLFRAIFIAFGAFLMKYHVAVLLLGVFLIFTGIKMFFSSTEAPDPGKNIVIRLLKKIFPIHPHIEGPQFFISKGKVRYATPLFLALMLIEVSDIIFAIDSVPAIFALTKEPLIVFTSNIFAILGLRSMYFMLSGAIEKFFYIKYGLAAVLVFVGLKMIYLNDAFGGKFPISWSLSIIALLIGSSIVASLIRDSKLKERGNI